MSISNRKIHGAISRENYDALEGLSQSDLSHMIKSPLHFKKRAELWSETDAMRLGTCIHAAILEPNSFKDRLAIEPEDFNGVPINRRLAAHRDYLHAWRDDVKTNKKYVLKPKEYDILIGILTQIPQTPGLKELLNGGAAEVAATWEFGGVKSKGRADYMVKHPKLGKCIVDIKTTQDASPSAFSRSIFNYAYDLQAAWYAGGFGADEYIFVVCEKKPPYPIAIYRADPSLLERGLHLAERLITKLKECEASGEYHGYTNGIDTILLPSWVAAQSKSGEHE